MISKYRTWCEVNLDTIYENFIKYRNFVGKDTKIMAVIKADAYGHGAIPVAENCRVLRTILQLLLQMRQ